MDIRFDRPNEGLDELIQELMDRVGVNHPRMIREMILTALKAGQENNYLADLKLMRTTMKEMRYTNKLFGPYRHRRKVTIFHKANMINGLEQASAGARESPRRDLPEPAG